MASTGCRWAILTVFVAVIITMVWVYSPDLPPLEFLQKSQPTKHLTSPSVAQAAVPAEQGPSALDIRNAVMQYLTVVAGCVVLLVAMYEVRQLAAAHRANGVPIVVLDFYPETYQAGRWERMDPIFAEDVNGAPNGGPAHAIAMRLRLATPASPPALAVKTVVSLELGDADQVPLADRQYSHLIASHAVLPGEKSELDGVPLVFTDSLYGYYGASFIRLSVVSEETLGPDHVWHPRRIIPPAAIWTPLPGTPSQLRPHD